MADMDPNNNNEVFDATRSDGDSMSDFDGGGGVSPVDRINENRGQSPGSAADLYDVSGPQTAPGTDLPTIDYNQEGPQSSPQQDPGPGRGVMAPLFGGKPPYENDIAQQFIDAQNGVTNPHLTLMFADMNSPEYKEALARASAGNPLTAVIADPESPEGKAFWNRVNQRNPLSNLIKMFEPRAASPQESRNQGEAPDLSESQAEQQARQGAAQDTDAEEDQEQ